MPNDITFVNFNSTPVATVVNTETGQVFIPLKPICEAIGIAWRPQLEKIKEDEVLSEAMIQIVIPSNGGNQNTICLPLDYINGWLFKLNPSKVAPEVKDRVIMYQRECYKVLSDHFQQKNEQQPKQLPYTPTQLAKIAIDDLSYIAEKFEVPKSFATQEIAKLATRLSGVDITSLLTQSVHMDNVPEEDVMLEPTELGKHFGLSGKAMNKKLEDLNLQYRYRDSWLPTEKGNPLCEKHAWAVKNKSGYNLKWRLSGIIELMKG